jgi:hypothetical protein
VDAVMEAVGALRRLGAQLGPYVMIELLVPGGTLVALALYLCRRDRAAGRRVERILGRLTARRTPLVACRSAAVPFDYAKGPPSVPSPGSPR